MFSEDELPLDVDINDPFFTEELEKTAGNLNGKTNEKKNKRKRRSEQEDTEEDKRKKVYIMIIEIYFRKGSGLLFLVETDIHFTSLHFTSLHFTSLHFTLLHCETL